MTFSQDDDMDTPHLVAPDGSEIKGTVDDRGRSWSGIIRLERRDNGALDFDYDTMGTRGDYEVEDVKIGGHSVFIDENDNYWLADQLVMSNALPPEDKCPAPLNLPTYGELLADRRHKVRALTKTRQAMATMTPAEAVDIATTVMAYLAGEKVDRNLVNEVDRKIRAAIAGQTAAGPDTPAAPGKGETPTP